MEKDNSDINIKLEKLFIEHVNDERKKEEEFQKFEKSQENVARYMKIIYDTFKDQGFNNDTAMYLTGLAYQNSFK